MRPATLRSENRSLAFSKVCSDWKTGFRIDLLNVEMECSIQECFGLRHTVAIKRPSSCLEVALVSQIIILRFVKNWSSR